MLTYANLNHLTFLKLLKRDNCWGDIHLVKSQEGEMMISKSVHVFRFKKPFSKEECLRSEISALEKCDHPNIVQPIAVHEDFTIGKLYLFTPYAEYGDLDMFLDFMNICGVSSKLLHTLFTDILRAVDYLHKMKMCHRDLKAANVLIFGEPGNYVAKVCDFGFAEQNAERKRGAYARVGTPMYASNFLLLGSLSNPYKNDVWALGVILHLMAVGRLPFEPKEKKLESLAKSVFDGLPPLPESVDKDVAELIRMMLDPFEEQRPYVEAIMTHRWVVQDN